MPKKPTEQVTAPVNIDQLKTQLMNASLVNELTRVLQSCTDLESIIKTILLGIQEIIGFNRVILFDIHRDSFSIRPRSWVGIDNFDKSNFSIPLGFEGGEITDSIFLNRHIIVESPDKDYDVFHRELNSENYLVLPLVSKANRKCFEVKNCTVTSCPVHGGHNPYCWSIQGSGKPEDGMSENDKRKRCIECGCFKCEGVFWMDVTRPITADDISLLSAITTVGGIILENYHILNKLEVTNDELIESNNQIKKVNHDLQIAQMKIDADLERARKIQNELLSESASESTDSFSIATRYVPATAVGGDYYDVFEITPGIFGIIIADVSGHGISSAMIMAMVKVLLKTFSSNELSPQKTLEKINEVFLNEIKSDNFVTIFYAVLDTNKNSMTYTSAGHCPILLVNKKSSEVTQIVAEGLFLGIFDNMMLNEKTIEYNPGESRLVLFTDGVTEAKNEFDDMFEQNRLENVVLETIQSSPEDLIDAILTAQEDFCGKGHEPEDDITLLILDY